MNAILATLGTDGDVFPYIGLGAQLRSRGHPVTLAAPEPYRALAEGLELAFRPLVTTEETDEMIADPDLFHPLRSGRMMARWGGRFIGRQYELLAELAQGADRVLIANPGVLAARLVQEKLRCPTATLLLQPGLLPSTVAPPEMPAGLTLPRGLPRALGELYWAGVDAVGYLLVARPLNPIRTSLGLPPVRRLFRWWLSPELVIGLFPHWYAAPQPDWPAQLRLAGFGRFDGARGGELADDVRAFCQSGTAPIAFTLGTGMTHAAEFFRAATEACTLLAARGLLITKYPHQLPPHLPPQVRHVAFAPFRQLLPRCAAVVHHGGIGTTAAALAAGIPQLILPLAWDQPDNAERVRRLGAGASLAPRHRTAAHLARALARLITPGVQARCRAIANQLRDTDGLAVAADWIEHLAARSRSPA
jgi:rhamnosyltransferase subunit B